MSTSTHRADLCNRILHPDIILPILSLLPPTYLPPILRASRYMHDLAGPLLYRDLPIPQLKPSALCPHLSPIASLFPPAASRSDLRAVLSGDVKCRKRELLESARVLRLEQHNHSVLPPAIQDLRLDMSKVKRLYVEDGKGVCECKGQCPIFRGLRPKTVILESTSLDIRYIGGLASSDQIEHLIVQFRPPNASTYPFIHSSTSSFLRRVKKVTILFTPPSYIDRNGRKIELAWVPMSRSICAKDDWTGQLSFTDILRYIQNCSQGVPEVVIVGTEKLDEGWVQADLKDEAGEQHREGRIIEFTREIMSHLSREDMGTERGSQTLLCNSLSEWRNGSDGAAISSPPITVGFKGKGSARRPVFIHKAITI